MSRGEREPNARERSYIQRRKRRRKNSLESFADSLAEKDMKGIFNKIFNSIGAQRQDKYKNRGGAFDAGLKINSVSPDRGPPNKSTSADTHPGARSARDLDKSIIKSHGKRGEDKRSDGIDLSKIREARNIIRGFKENSVSKSTKERYRKLSERLEKKGMTPEKISGTKKSFYAYRAAEVYRHKVSLQSALRERDKAYRSKDFDLAKIHEDKIKESLEFFHKYQPGGTREENMRRGTRVKINETAERSNAKRKAMSELPEDWRDKVWKNSSPRDHDAIAVTAVTGLRPSELEKGVKIKRVIDGLEFSIRGSKVDNERQKGQVWRTINVSNNELRTTVEGRHLVASQKRQYREIKLDGAAKAFTARINRAGMRAMPSLQQKISPYTYRHAFSSRLKADGRTPEDIAKAMGHRAERSQQEYGRKGQVGSAGKGGITSARAAAPVRTRR